MQLLNIPYITPQTHREIHSAAEYAKSCQYFDEIILKITYVHQHQQFSFNMSRHIYKAVDHAGL